MWVVGALLEGIRDPHKFVATTEAAFDSEKPLVVLKVGRSEVARRSVIAHTGSLAGADAVVDAVLRQKGAIRIASPEELIETCALLATSGWPRGGRTAVVTTSGGAWASGVCSWVSQSRHAVPVGVQPEPAYGYDRERRYNRDDGNRPHDTEPASTHEAHVERDGENGDQSRHCHKDPPENG